MKALEIKFQRGTSPLGPPPGSDPDNAGIICIKQYKTCNSIATTAIQFLQPIGNLGIGISTSAAVLASASAPTLQKIYFCLSKFFLKKYIIYVQYTSIFFLVLSHQGSVSFCYNHSFLYDFSFIQPVAAVIVSKIFRNFSVTHPRLSPFKY